MTAGPSPSPFDELSTDHDDTFGRSEIGRRMRTAVWHRLDRVVHPGHRVLEHLHRWERRIARNPLAVRLADHDLVELRRR